MRGCRILDLAKTSNGVHDEDGLVGVHARQWVSALHVPIDIVDHIGEKGGIAAVGKFMEELLDVTARCVCTIGVCCRGPKEHERGKCDEQESSREMHQKDQ